MSKIYFHSEHADTVEVEGPERRAGDCFGREIALRALDLDAYGHHWNKELAALVEPKLDANHKFAATTLNVDSDQYEFVLPDGSRYGVWSTLMNTTIALSSAPVQFLVRLHAQCEIFAWVAGEDRSWLADVIEDGRESGVMRPHMGWENVIELLRSRSDGEVVTSYSGTARFPDPERAGRVECEAWYELPIGERWQLGMKALRAVSGPLQITPDNLSDPTFFGGVKRTNGLKIMEVLGEKVRIEREAKLAAIKASGKFPSIFDL